ncbi:MAG: cytidine deaminase [Syntrophomonadaceae bacterium]|jgi:cytidine deaminase
MDINGLIGVARKALNNSYSPYSGFKVGAALLTEDGRIYSGVNVENASFGLTVCAERIAVFKAVSEGQREFVALAVASSGDAFIYPCGACLQVLAEFSPQIKIFVTNQQDEYQEYHLSDLLPSIFVLDK